MHSKTKLIFRKIEKPLHYHPKIFSVERKNIVFQYEFFFVFVLIRSSTYQGITFIK